MRQARRQRLPVIPSVSGAPVLALGPGAGAPDGSDPDTALKKPPGRRPEKPRLGKKNFMYSVHRPWEMTTEVSQGGRDARTNQKASCRRHPTSGPCSHAEAIQELVAEVRRATYGSQVCHLPAVWPQMFLNLSVPQLLHL